MPAFIPRLMDKVAMNSGFLHKVVKLYAQIQWSKSMVKLRIPAENGQIQWSNSVIKIAISGDQYKYMYVCINLACIHGSCMC